MSSDQGRKRCEATAELISNERVPTPCSFLFVRFLVTNWAEERQPVVSAVSSRMSGKIFLLADMCIVISQSQTYLLLRNLRVAQ